MTSSNFNSVGQVSSNVLIGSGFNAVHRSERTLSHHIYGGFLGINVLDHYYNQSTMVENYLSQIGDPGTEFNIGAVSHNIREIYLKNFVDVNLLVSGNVRVGELDKTANTDSKDNQVNLLTKVFFNGGYSFNTLLDSDNQDKLSIYRFNYQRSEDNQLLKPNSILRFDLEEGDTQGSIDFQIGTLNYRGDGDSSFGTNFKISVIPDTKTVGGVTTKDGGIPFIQIGIVDEQDNPDSANPPFLYIKDDNVAVIDQDKVIERNYVALFSSITEDEVDSILTLRYSSTAASAGLDDTSGFINFMGNNSAGQDVSYGEIEAYSSSTDATSGVSYLSSSADYAEYLEKFNHDEMIKPGDVCGVFGGKVKASVKGADHIMVASTSPIIAGNWPGDDKIDDYVLMAFLGQVDVKVTGNVKKGDLLVASHQYPTYAESISESELDLLNIDLIIGRAWESNENQTRSVVKAIIGFPFVSEALNNKILKLQDRIYNLNNVSEDTFNQMELKIQKQKKLIKVLENKLSMMDQ